MLCSSSSPFSPRNGSSVFSECVRMLELPARNESSMTEGRRVFRSHGKHVVAGPCRAPTAWAVARRAQSNRSSPRSGVARSSTMIPTSSASNAGPYSNLDTLPNIAGVLSSDALDEVSARCPSTRQIEGKIHQQSDKAMNVAILDREVDVEEQNQIVASGRLAHRTASRHRRE